MTGFQTYPGRWMSVLINPTEADIEALLKFHQVIEASNSVVAPGVLSFTIGEKRQQLIGMAENAISKRLHDEGRKEIPNASA